MDSWDLLMSPAGKSDLKWFQSVTISNSVNFVIWKEYRTINVVSEPSPPVWPWRAGRTPRWWGHPPWPCRPGRWWSRRRRTPGGPRPCSCSLWPGSENQIRMSDDSRSFRDVYNDVQYQLFLRQFDSSNMSLTVESQAKPYEMLSWNKETKEYCDSKSSCRSKKILPGWLVKSITSCACRG